MTLKKMGARVALAMILAFVACNVGCKPQPQGTDQNNYIQDGTEALDKGEWSRAYDAFSQAIQEDAQNADAYYGRAAASSAQAEEHYQLAQAAATNGDQKKGMEEVAKADSFFAKSIQDCDAALKVDPAYSDAYYLKGVAAQYQGRWNDGIDAFSECVKLAPNNAQAYHRRGEIYDNIGDYVNSTVDFKKASELGYADANSDKESAPDDFSDLKYDVDEGETNDAN